ncbi:MAG TPA: outer membrane lipoprotein carrier protein LolA [Polyangiaceae bacterium]|jgi:outer membrane lipoprotein carrier protein|nr:outer membrane lipoprotein carrier protein LolA [Polyangiaceae bacterium]
MLTRRTLLLLAAGAATTALGPSALAGPTGAPAPAAPAAPGAPVLNAEQIADRIQAFYDKTRTFKAAFKQVYTAKAYGKTKEGLGTVILEKPGKMSWRYSNNGNRIVSDGKIIRVYEKENQQMYEQPLDKSPYPAALAFLVGTGSLKQSFKLSKLDPKAMNFEGGFVLAGEPREATPAYQKMLLYVDAATFQVRRVLLLDAQGNKNRFDFTGTEVNLKAPPGEFSFIPPKGTQVVRP